jgi:methyl-accepting chemotaxis protein
VNALAAPDSSRRRALSIRLKLFVLITAMIVTLVAFFVIYFAARQVTLLEMSVLNKGDFLAQQLRTAIAFDDKETTREVFEAAHNSPEILHLALFHGDGRLLQADGSGDLTAPEAVREARLVSDGDRMRVIAPVVSLEGPRGTLVIELDTSRLRADIRAVRATTLGIGCVGLLIGCIAAWLVGTSFAHRLERVRKSAAAVASGDLAQPGIDGGPNDEIGQTVVAFNAMVTSLRTLVAKLSETSAQLEGASETFLDIVRAHGDDMTAAVAQAESAVRQHAPSSAVTELNSHMERLTEGTKTFSDGLVPGLIELKQYADDLNRVIGGFKVANDVTAHAGLVT